jgi:2-C-methyl-D-erythritol 4-phosphate cytidylyltransferase
MSELFALLLAAGSGTRMGRSGKALLEVGPAPMFVHSLRVMAQCPAIGGVVLVVPDGFVDDATSLAYEEGTSRVIVATGGDSRKESVARGLREVPADVEAVLCHDAARPFATLALYERVIAGLSGADGVVPTLPSPDTVKRVLDGVVVETIPRDEVGLVQTPQAFRRAALEDAHRRSQIRGRQATDDAMFLEATGYRVVAVEGEPANFKITTPDDLRRAKQQAREFWG